MSKLEDLKRLAAQLADADFEFICSMRPNHVAIDALVALCRDADKLLAVVEAAKAVSDYNRGAPDWNGEFCPWDKLQDALAALEEG